ncbi:sodium:proton antiporter [Pseudomonas panipatensis]|uniref:sodium:proton antiporter n=1 Tax=Pseudomonas panipatensis TaxID=428992 RepID=UPI0035B01228
MTAILFWLAIPLLFAVAIGLGKRLQLLPIVTQLLVASLLLPLLFISLQSHGLDVRQLVTVGWLRPLYDLAFALLLGQILADVIDLRIDRQSLKIALPSFGVPLLCGMLTAIFLLDVRSLLSALGIGLLFAITAIPVLYLYLRDIAYPADATRRLMHAAVLMDLLCWSLFGIAQGSGDPLQLLWPLLGGSLPWLLHTLNARRPLFYSLCLFALMLALQHWRLNTLVFAISYLLCQATLRVPFVPPLGTSATQALQNYLLVPLVLSYGILQVDFQHALGSYSWLYLGALLVLPVMSKLAGNWLGLRWALPRQNGAQRWRDCLLLNIRGLTEIVFLNLLFQHGLIDSLLYFSLLLMSLFSTLLPALCGIRRKAVTSAPKDIAQARSP